jgi:1,6-anhydro-N-acetylmuramate kinase
MTSTSRTRHVIGCMTGTSLDGIDAALVRVEGSGLEMKVELVALSSRSLGSVAESLRRLATAQPMTAQEVAAASLLLGELHADICKALAAEAPGVDLVVLHGQTVVHQPPVSLQLINPWPVAHQFGCDVVSDLRGADLAAGGEGAPITPLADLVLYRRVKGPRLIVNLGGFCNVTHLPADVEPSTIRGFDVCVCNQLLDAVARQAMGQPFDRDGSAAISGTIDRTFLEASRTSLLRQRSDGRSLGTGDERFGFLKELAPLAPEDQLATAAAAVGSTIGCVLRETDARAEVIVAGGGARNRAVVAAVAGEMVEDVRSSDDLGVPIEGREAMAMAVLGALAADGVDVTVPQVTQRQDVVAWAGQWIRGKTHHP